MHTPESFQVANGYASFCPERQCTFQESVDLTCAAIEFARDNQIGLLLVDTTRLTGFGAPSILQRFYLGERIAETAMSMVKVAMVTKPEMIEDRQFTVTVARNRGMITEPFDSEGEAVSGLFNPQAL